MQINIDWGTSVKVDHVSRWRISFANYSELTFYTMSNLYKILHRIDNILFKVEAIVSNFITVMWKINVEA